MTTGRINQISWSRPPGPAPFRINNGRRRVPGGPEPPKGPGCNSVITWKGRTSARPPRQPPAHRGDARTWPSNCPHCSPSDTGPHAGCSTSPPLRALCGLRHTGLGWGVRPRGHADERRLPRGGSPRESGYQDWPAANDPQTPSVPGTKRPPGFGHPSGPTPRPGTFKPGERRHRCGGRPPPFLRRGSRECGSPQRHQPQRGGLPGREGCVGAPAAAFPRGGVLAFAFITPTYTLRHRLGARASRTHCRAPSRCPGGHPTMGVGHQGRIPRTRWATHISPLGVPRVVWSSVRGLAGNVHGREGPWHRANWRATHPGGMGVLRRPASAATDREGSGGPAHGPPPATAPTMQRGPRALVSGYTMRLHACALRPSPFAPSLLPGPSSPPLPTRARPEALRSTGTPTRVPRRARGPWPRANWPIAPAGPPPGPRPAPGPRPPSLPRTAHPPPPTGQWPPTTRAGVRLCASPRPPHPPAPAPVAAAAALHPTPYTLLTVRRRVERSHQTRTRPITRESSPARESNSARVTHSVGPQRECTVARVRRLLTDSPAPLGHGRCLPTPAGPAPGPGGRPTPRLSGSHHRPPTGQSGPRWRTPCGLPDGHARLPTGREPLGRQPAPRQLTGDDVFPHQRLPTGQRVRTCRATRREATAVSRSPASPLQAPGAAGGDDGEVCLHKSSQGSG